MKKIPHLKSLAFLIMLFCAVNFGFGQSIFSNPITGTSPQTDNPYTTGQTFDPNITVSGIGRGSGLGTPVGTNDRYNANNWGSSLDLTDYFEFTITPNSGYEIDFVSFVYSSQRSNGTISNFAFRSSIDGFTSDIATPSYVAPPTQTTINLNTAAYQNITSTITFRFYAWGANNGSRTFSINDFTFNGVVSLSSICSAAAVTWDGTTSTWDNANVGPNINTPAIITGNYNTTTNGSFSACSLTVNSGTLSIGNNTYVEVQNDLIATGNIVVQPQGSFIQNNDLGSVSGTGLIQVIKQTAPMRAWYEYTYWSSPVAGESFDALGDTDPNRRYIFNGENYLDATAETNNDNSTNPGQDDIDDNGDDWQWVSGSTIMQPGIGYAATLTESAYNFAPGVAPKQITLSPFEGFFNNGVYTVPIYRNDSELNDNNWNLIGNPYPSAIDVDLFLAANTEIEETDMFPPRSIVGAIYLWSQDTAPSALANGNQGLNFSDSDYAIINGITEIAGGDSGTGNTDPSNRKIPSGQAFFVSYSDAATPVFTYTNSDGHTIAQGNVTFNNSMRALGTATDNSQFYKNSNQKKASSQDNKLWVNLTSDNGVFNQIAIAYVNNATDFDDGSFYDTQKPAGIVTGAILYSNIEGSDKKFGIQGKASTSLDIDETISLGFKSNIEVATLFKLSIDHLEGEFLSENTIYLKDNLLNKVHNLSDSEYIFTTEVGEFNNRFEIVFTGANALSTDTFDLNKNHLSIIELDGNQVQFGVSDNLKIKTVQVFDLLGRQLYSFNGQNSTETYTLQNIKSMVYIARVILSNGAVITKKAVKK